MGNKIKVEKDNGIFSIGKKIIADDAKSVGGKVMDGVIIPGIKRLITESVKNAIDWIIYGGKNPNTNYTNNGKIISYSSIFGQQQNNPKPTNPVPAVYNYSSILYPDRSTAETVLLKCKDMVSNYGMISVADYYQFINETAGESLVKACYTDGKHGWRNLDNVTITDNGNGYKINFPKLESLE